MEDSNDYWKMMDFQQQAPIFTNIDWNQNNSNNSEPMDFDKVIPPQQQQPFQPFQRRRSSSVDLPINPLYLNTVNREATIQEEEGGGVGDSGTDFLSWFPTTVNDFDFTRMNRIGSSATLEFPGFNSNPFIFNNNQTHQQNNTVNSTTAAPTTTSVATVISSGGIESPPPLSTTSSENNEHTMMSSPPPATTTITPNTPVTHKRNTPSPSKQQLTQEQQQQTITFFPELHRTSYNTILGKQLKQHQKRRRSSSLPPVFTHKQKQQHHVPTPLIFTQIQVTDPTPPIHHATKKSKQPQDTRPVAIERVHKPVPKPQVVDPVETQKKLDQELLVVNFEDVTVAELKEMLRERGLPATGKKAVLTDRLRDARDLLIKGKWSSSSSSSTSTAKQAAVATEKAATTAEKAVALTLANNQQQKTSTTTVSPHIQGLANMTIHSPIVQQNETFFVPMDQDCPDNNNFFNDIDSTVYHTSSSASNSIKMEGSVSPNQPTLDSNYQYQNSHTVHSNHENELLDINDIFNFDSTNSMLDTTAILFPPSSTSPSTWDCDNNKYPSPSQQPQHASSVNNSNYQHQQNTNNNNTNNSNIITPGNEWDQDKLDLFLTELV